MKYQCPGCGTSSIAPGACFACVSDGWSEACGTWFPPTRKHIASLPEIPDPGEPMSPAARRRLQRELYAQMLAALQGSESRLADMFVSYHLPHTRKD